MVPRTYKHFRPYMIRKKYKRYDELLSSGFVKNEHGNQKVNNWVMSYFLFRIQLWIESVTNVSAERVRENSWNMFYEVKNKTSIWKQEANIEAIHNSFMLMFDVRTMLTISNVTEWKIRMITFSFVPTWLAAKIFKNGRVVEEAK